MGVGLGRNSPIVLSLGKENYEALIERHGQWMRWRVANKCSCVDKHTFSPNIHCERCGGRGWIYSYQKEKEVCLIVMCSDNSGIITLDKEYRTSELKGVYNSKNKRLSVIKNDEFLTFTDEIPHKSEYLTVIMTKSLEKHTESMQAEKVYRGYYKLNLTVNRTGIDGLYYTAPCDIVHIDSVTDATGTEYDVKEYRENIFYIECKETDDGLPIPIAEPVVAHGVKYIEPFLFVLLSQNLNNRDASEVTSAKGDAVLSFPYNLNVAQGDVITALAGTYTNKEVITKSDSDTDTLSAYFVDSVIKLVGDLREYSLGTDFLLVGTNKIKWTCNDAPLENTNYSITYTVHPTYVVLKNIPQLRTSENQRIPKKAVVKLVATYSEMTKINRQ